MRRYGSRPSAGAPFNVSPPVLNPVFTLTGPTTLVEGTGGGPTPLTVTVHRANNITGAHSVRLMHNGGTVESDDFTAAVSPDVQVDFADTETSKDVTININPDTAIEGNETLILALALIGGVGLLGSPNSLQTQITNDDSAPPAEPVFTLAGPPTIDEGNGSPTNVPYTIYRANDVSQADTVKIGITGGSVNAADFNGGSIPAEATINFAINDTQKTWTPQLAGDFVFEGNETIDVALNTPSRGALGNPYQVTTIVANDDSSGGPPTDLPETVWGVDYSFAIPTTAADGQTVNGLPPGLVGSVSNGVLTLSTSAGSLE